MCCWVDVRDPNTVFYYTSVNGSHFHISAWWKATAMFLPEKLTVLAQRHSDSESWSHVPLVSPRGISFQSGEKYIFFYLIWVVPRITHRTKKSQRSRNLLWIKRNIIGFYSKPHSSPRRTNMAANSAQKKTTITIKSSHIATAVMSKKSLSLLRAANTKEPFFMSVFTSVRGDDVTNATVGGVVTYFLLVYDKLWLSSLSLLNWY